MTTKDVVVQFGERAVLEPLGACITPTGAPNLVAVAGQEGYLSTADFFSGHCS